MRQLWPQGKYYDLVSILHSSSALCWHSKVCNERSALALAAAADSVDALKRDNSFLQS
jgi:hypothetical protein